MRRRGRTPYTESDVEINLTPLIDVVFVVLIVFIIIAPMLEFEKVELVSGGDSELKKTTSVHEKSRLSLLVKGDNSIWINEQCIAPADLSTILRKQRDDNPHQIPQLFHDKNASFGTYQTVKNALESAGFEEMDLIVKPG